MKKILIAVSLLVAVSAHAEMKDGYIETMKLGGVVLDKAQQDHRAAMNKERWEREERMKQYYKDHPEAMPKTVKTIGPGYGRSASAMAERAKRGH